MWAEIARWAAKWERWFDRTVLAWLEESHSEAEAKRWARISAAKKQRAEFEARVKLQRKGR